MVESTPPEARLRPSGANASDVTGGPGITRISCPDQVSHKWMGRIGSVLRDISLIVEPLRARTRPLFEKVNAAGMVLPVNSNCASFWPVATDQRVTWSLLAPGNGF